MPSNETPWLCFSDKDLLSDCTEEFIRSGGPGGQKRNKTSSAVRLTHLPTGIIVKATESRSREENRTSALRHLRRTIALEIRRDLDLDHYKSPALTIGYQDASNRFRINKKNPHWPLVVSHILDLLQATRGRVSECSNLLGCSTGQLIDFLSIEPDLLAAANAVRASHGVKPLKAN
ncbi:MAG: peptide chain release factor-like protein [Planctomycetota bacterium]|nr:peptide chain release factor-like protein [Planctomycetota bacterium]MDA1139441.1 peptide chain release factor-like protein [Planctomycetota bacterium]